VQKVLLVDDLDNDQAADETLTFVIDDEAYAVDLSEANAKGFREAVEPYRVVARRLGRHKVRPSAPVKAARPAGVKKKPREVPAEWYKVVRDDPPDVKAAKQEYRQRVRAWGIEHGQVRSTRGTMPREVYQAYEEWAVENGVESGPASVGL
jgi:nucleoid-associated protein Lsr2